MSELDDLEKQMAELKAKMKAIIDTQRKDILKEILKNIRQYEFTQEELGFGVKNKKPTKVNKPVTFRDPATGKEWDGELDQKGRKPTWISEKIKDKTIENYRVK